MKLVSGIDNPVDVSAEVFESELFESLIQPGMNVVELGAYNGMYSIIASKLIGSSGRIIAFEPSPSNFKLLSENIIKCGCSNIEPIQKAVCNRTGTVTLYLSLGNTHPTGNKIFDTGNKDFPVETVDVECTSLDDFFEHDFRLDILKMDIEGSEYSVLNGMQRLLSNSSDLIIFTEFLPTLLRMHGYSPECFLQSLERNGFTLYNIDEITKRVYRVSIGECMELCPEYTHTDLVCTRRSHLKSS